MTQTAEKLFDSAVAMEEKVLGIGRQAANMDDALAGPLKLTVAFELANRLIIPQLGEFISRYPAIDLQLLMTKGLVNLAAMEADLAIRMTPTPPEHLVGREIMKLRHGIYGSQPQLRELSRRARVILFESELLPPAWVNEHFRHAQVALRVDDVGSMAVAAANGLGLAKLPCFIGDTVPGLRRLDRKSGESQWGIWMLNHVDLRATARVRACKEYLLELLESKRALIQGEQSQYSQQ